MTRPLPRIPPDRDLSVDFVRAICLPVVVVLHALQMGIEGSPPRAFNALADWAPLAGLTWIGMIMPTFFIAGGFAGITTWRRLHHQGESAGHYIRVRTLRLARPVLFAMLAVLAALGVMAWCGADAEFLRTFAFRLAEPLWFIAVYAICTSFVPVMAFLHRHWAWPTFFGLAALALLVDGAVRLLHLPVGALNWLFIWLFVQQLGFGVRDSWYARRPRWVLVVLTLAAYGLIAVAVFALGYSPDMIANLNPPTIVLLLLGLAQVYLFTLLQPAIRRMMTHRGALVFVGVLGTYGMVIYLWHTVAMAVVAGAQLALGLPFPSVLGPTWWVTRLPWFLAIVVVIAACCAIVPRIEALWPRERERRMPLWAALTATVILIAAVGWVLTQGYLTPLTAVAVALLAGTVGWLTVGGPARSGRSDRLDRLEIRAHPLSLDPSGG
ncbi:acyltransferase family protein [Microbacterium rhizophilus]|uniref:acyltransferase family protein n=1 Tax=Microbacterium rhizophilus TaxID=3138934 RepID=UPI0031F0F999